MHKEKYPHFEMGQNLKMFVKKSGLNFKEFAEKLEVTHDTVMKWFAGHNRGYLKRLDDICKILDIQIDELYEGKKKKEPTEWTFKGDKDQEISYLRGRIDSLEAIIADLIRSRL